MKTVNFDFKVKNLSGTPVEDFNTKEQVANILASGSTHSPVKMMEMARKIYNDGSIELLSEDFNKLREAILNTNRLTDLAKAQILEVLDAK